MLAAFECVIHVGLPGAGDDAKLLPTAAAISRADYGAPSVAFAHVLCRICQIRSSVLRNSERKIITKR